MSLSHSSTLKTRVLYGVAILALVSTTSGLAAEAGWHDNEFDRVPFAQWIAGGTQTSLKWSEHLLPVVLSVHQRLLARLQIQLDGAEAAKRRGEGEIIFYFQLTDAKGRIYQDHSTYDLAKVEEGLKAQDLVCTESAFVLPGDYSVAVAIYDTATKEHSLKKDKLHVAPLKVEPLPDSWRDLAPVEFVEPSETPDHWFLPKEQGRLHLSLVARRPVQIEVLGNLTPSELTGRSYGIQDRILSFLFPALKVITEIHATNVVVNTALLDLSRRSIVYHQDAAQELNWEKIKSSLANANSASIDVKSLADRKHNAAFLLKEVMRRAAGGEATGPRAVIVISGPMIFDAEQDLAGVELKASPDSRVFYIRIQGMMVSRPGFASLAGRRRGPGGFPGRPPMPGEEVGTPNGLGMDQLEPMLKPLDPHLFDVTTAEQFRKALATIMGEIASM